MRNVSEYHISLGIGPEGRVLTTQPMQSSVWASKGGIAEPHPAACLFSTFKRNSIFYRSELINTQFVQTVLLENIKAMTKDKAPKYNIDLKMEMTQGAWK